MTSTNFDTSLDLFVKNAQDRINEYYKKSNHPFPAPVLSLEPGSKYVKVVKTEHSSRSVYCFVEKSTGNVLKAAGWKTPAKGARGNIFNADNGMGGVTVWGGVYR